MLWLCIRLPSLERPVLLRLAHWAQQWSSWVSLGADECEPGPAWLWLEIGASLKIFGGHEALRAEVVAALELLGHVARTAIAPTPQAARLLTMSREPCVVTTLALLPQRLAPLPLDLLALPPAALAALHSTGLRRLGEVLALSDAALAQRFGFEAALYLQRLRGAASEPMPTVPFPDHYQGSAEFDHEVQEAGALLFPLQRLLWELQGYLRAADRALQHCQLRFEHRGGRSSELTLRCSVPSREAAQWLALAREQFGALTLAAPVRALSLLASEFTAPAIGQGDFFSTTAAHGQALHETLDRLRARLGQACVQQLQPASDYRPERAWRSAALERLQSASLSAATSAAAPMSLQASVAPRPCWLLREPRPLDSPPSLLAGPERIESGWWDRGDIARDYYLARDADNARLWVYQDLRSGAWFLHGLWA